MKSSLRPPDKHHLSAAQGRLGLGNWQEANEELEEGGSDSGGMNGMNTTP
jgi:hypothetical protein